MRENQLYANDKTTEEVDSLSSEWIKTTQIIKGSRNVVKNRYFFGHSVFF